MRRSLLLLLALIVSYAAASMIMSVIALYVLEDPMVNSLSMFVVYTGTSLLTIVAMTFFGRTQQWHLPSPRPRIERLNLPLIVLALLMIVMVDILLTPLYEIMPDTDLSAMFDMMRGGMWAVVTGVIAAPILEEFLFRGIIQSNMIKFSNPYVGIVVASVVFGVAHMIPQQAVAAICTAMIIGTIFYLTGSLMTAIVIHMLNNGLAYIMLMYFGEEFELVHALFSSDEQFWVAYIVSAIFMCAMLWLGIVRIGKSRKAKRPDFGLADPTK